MKQICVFLLSMLLTACVPPPDSAELVPYDLSEKEQFVLETFGMLESSQLLSFHAPEEAITLRVHVYQMLSGGAWEETGGGATSIGAEREPVDRLDGYFAMRLRKTWVLISTFAVPGWHPTRRMLWICPQRPEQYIF